MIRIYKKRRKIRNSVKWAESDLLLRMADMLRSGLAKRDQPE